MEYNSYFELLKEILYWFRNLSPSTIDKFNETDADHLAKIVPGLKDDFLLLKEVKQLAPAISKCLNIAEVANMLKNNCKFYPRVCLLYQFLLTLPITVASTERSFSKLKLIKTYLKSTMNNDRLFYLLISSIECDLLDSAGVQQLVNDWAKMKDRKICIQK